MLKLKLQYFGHLMRRADSLEKTLMLGKTEGRRRRGWYRTRWLDGIINSRTWVWANSKRYWRTGKPGMLQSMGSQIFGLDCVMKQRQQEQNGHPPLNWNYLYTHTQSRVKTLLQASPSRLTPWITGKWFQAKKEEDTKK